MKLNKSREQDFQMYEQTMEPESESIYSNAHAHIMHT